MSKIIPIGEVLKEYGYITDEQLSQALVIQKKDGKRPTVRLVRDALEHYLILRL